MKRKQEKKQSKVNWSLLAEQHCEELRSQSRHGTAETCRSACNRFLSFIVEHGGDTELLTPTLMRDFDEHLKKRQLSSNSVCTYLSNLRSVYNAAISKGFIDKGINPFQSVRIHPERTEKRSIKMTELAEIASLHLVSEVCIQARDFFIFSFLASGIPFIDLAYLTTDNIKGNCLVYYRHKTNIRVSIGLTHEMRTILARYAGQGVGKCLFPILKTENASYKEYRSCLKTYNRHLEKVSFLMKNPVKLTSYVARHTWATEAKRQNIPLGVISEALGHMSEKTTRYYLGSFDQSQMNKANRRVIRHLEEQVFRRKEKCPLFIK